jgi:alkylhydroperoxidase family enzyme
MARIELRNVATLSDVDRIQYDRFPSNLSRALLRTKNCTEGYLDLGFALRANNLDQKQYELVILRVAALSKSAYERMQHLPPARHAGWSDSEIESIESGRCDKLDCAASALVAFVDECVKDVRVSDGTFAKLRSHLSDGAIADTALLVGFYMMTARFLETLDVELDAAPCDVLMTR